MNDSIHFTTSAKTGEGIGEAFEDIVRRIETQYGANLINNRDTQSIKISQANQPKPGAKKKKKKCC